MTSVYTFRAVNQAKASQNKIHDDETARAYGFAGGLVPGVTIFAYMAEPVVANLGREWLESGRISARFYKPLYEGEEAKVELGQGEGSEVSVLLSNPAGEVCAEGQASLEHADPPDLDEFPWEPLLENPPRASEEVLRSIKVLGTYEPTFKAERANEYLKSIGIPAFNELLAHPGWVLPLANTALTSNVRLGPWIHASSEVQNFSSIADGEHLQVRGKVADVFERKGHRFVELDLLLLADGSRPASRIRHVAIWEPRKATN